MRTAASVTTHTNDLQRQQLQQPPPLSLQPQAQTQSRPQGQQRKQLLPQDNHEDLSKKGYTMLRDDGKLTVQKAWDAFHGPVTAVRLEDKKKRHRRHSSGSELSTQM
ncbi:hypothetical protein MVEG_01295 [Podila verticillata NRRL 6337]|nr:hypothetical protein MVEG_01295 [Podila verticillata NRRL 6337]